MNTNARTAPSVSGSPKVNRRQLRALEVHLGAFQLAVLLGLVTGSMACAFYLGFFSGQRVGYENALVGSASTLARFALNTKELNSSEMIGNDGAESASALVKDERRTGPRASRESKDVFSGSDLNELSAAAKPKNETQVAIPPAVVGGGAIVGAAVQDQSAEDSKADPVASKALPAPEDEVIRVYGNERTPKRTSIATLKEESRASAPPKPIKSEVVSEVKVVKPQTQQKPQVLASLQPEAKANRVEPSSTRRVESVPVKSILAAGWYAQVAAPRKMADAEALANRIRKNGFPVSIESASVKGEAYYRVIVGPEDNKKQAQVLVEQLKSERSIQGEPFIRNIR